MLLKLSSWRPKLRSILAPLHSLLRLVQEVDALADAVEVMVAVATKATVMEDATVKVATQAATMVNLVEISEVVEELLRGDSSIS